MDVGIFVWFSDRVSLADLNRFMVILHGSASSGLRHFVQRPISKHAVATVYHRKTF